jgi:hypothetical protein
VGTLKLRARWAARCARLEDPTAQWSVAFRGLVSTKWARLWGGCARGSHASTTTTFIHAANDPACGLAASSGGDALHGVSMALKPDPGHFCNKRKGAADVDGPKTGATQQKSSGSASRTAFTRLTGLRPIARLMPQMVTPRVTCEGWCRRPTGPDLPALRLGGRTLPLHLPGAAAEAPPHWDGDGGEEYAPRMWSGGMGRRALPKDRNNSHPSQDFTPNCPSAFPRAS